MSSPRKHVVIYTDGACSGNPGPGGWAALLRYNHHEKVLTGTAAHTTNNRMELTAVIEALRALKEPCQVDLYTDSNYIVRAFQKGWLERWQRNGWRTSRKQPVENQDLWRQLLELTRRHDVRFRKVKGHANDPLNNRVDQLAVEAMRRAYPHPLPADPATQTAAE
ncbi:MAG: ribonuclease HI [Rhodothermus sp.]|nr:ribonuclease HI [Rhodothermus sp.]